MQWIVSTEYIIHHMSHVSACMVINPASRKHMTLISLNKYGLSLIWQVLYGIWKLAKNDSILCSEQDRFTTYLCVFNYKHTQYNEPAEPIRVNFVLRVTTSNRCYCISSIYSQRTQGSRESQMKLEHQGDLITYLFQISYCVSIFNPVRWPTDFRQKQQIAQPVIFFTSFHYTAISCFRQEFGLWKSNVAAHISLKSI